MREDLLPPKEPPRRHLISIGDLGRDDVERLLGTARNFERSLERELKKLPTLRGRTVVNLFYESSTRTSSSFELAAKRLSADVMTIRADDRRVRPGRDRHPARADRRGEPGRAGDGSTRHQRGRREAPASDAGAAR